MRGNTDSNVTMAMSTIAYRCRNSIIRKQCMLVGFGLVALARKKWAETGARQRPFQVFSDI
jgi:hypothetical protein